MERLITFENQEFYQYLSSLSNNYQVMMSFYHQKISDAMIDNQMTLTSVEANSDLMMLILIIKKLYDQKITLETRDLIYLMNVIKAHQLDQEAIMAFYTNNNPLITLHNGTKLYPKTLTQYQYLKALEHNLITFGVGSAGTGKTFLAVAYAVTLLKRNRIKRIIITRPAVEAGEKLGFLPGDLKEKVDPYLIPIYDSLEIILGYEQLSKLLEKRTIEIAPLAYMRGRTLDDAVIILDEAQNTTSSQMKMFLTRLGFNSKMIITGDMTQIDLPNHKLSGLKEATHRLKDIDGLSIIPFTELDVMRNPIVKQIIERYEDSDYETPSN